MQCVCLSQTSKIRVSKAASNAYKSGSYECAINEILNEQVEKGNARDERLVFRNVGEVELVGLDLMLRLQIKVTSF